MKICVLCGSNNGTRNEYLRAASDLGAWIATGGHSLVYGGAEVGLMGEVANAALRGGARVVGVIPRMFNVAGLEVAHRGLSELVVVETLHERKAAMAERSDAYLVLPGGFGTLDELFETLTWAQLGLHSRPIVLINIEGFFDPLLYLISAFIAEGFVRPQHRQLFEVVAAVNDLPDLATIQPVAPLPKWIRNS